MPRCVTRFTVLSLFLLNIHANHKASCSLCSPRIRPCIHKNNTKIKGGMLQIRLYNLCIRVVAVAEPDMKMFYNPAQSLPENARKCRSVLCACAMICRKSKPKHKPIRIQRPQTCSAECKIVDQQVSGSALFVCTTRINSVRSEIMHRPCLDRFCHV